MNNGPAPLTPANPEPAPANFTVENLAAAFTEWDRRYREDPEAFESEATHLLKGTPETYGDVAAPYFLKILKEVNAS